MVILWMKEVAGYKGRWVGKCVGRCGQEGWVRAAKVLSQCSAN